MPRIYETVVQNLSWIAKDIGKSRSVKDDSIADEVGAIISGVRERGDDALFDYAQRFDGIEIENTGLRIDSDQFERYISGVGPELSEALKEAACRISDYHSRQLPEDCSWQDELGNRQGWRWHPVLTSGHYVPGGRALYPSSVLMSVLPARAAGVSRLVMTSPLGHPPDPAVIFAAQLSGVDCIYRLGGAHAIAAMALGTCEVTPVDMIAGPGNKYVTEAKRQLFGLVGIDMIAGPSELAVICDHQSDASLVAADLIAQAEHDPSACPVLISTCKEKAKSILSQIGMQLSGLPREAIARASWDDNGVIVIVRDGGEAAEIANLLAPEHLTIMVENPSGLAGEVHTAGAIFIGHLSAEAIGDYIAGSSHVLPTSSAARYTSGLSVLNFMRRTSMLEMSRKGIERLGPHAMVIASAEHLEGHGRSIAMRLATESQASR